MKKKLREAKDEVKRERQTYQRLKKYVADRCPEHWPEIEKALVARGQYFVYLEHTSKSNLANFMLGRDLVDTKRPLAIDWIASTIKDLLKNWEDAERTYNQSLDEDGKRGEVLSAIYNLELGMIDKNKQSLREIADSLEGMYG